MALFALAVGQRLVWLLTTHADVRFTGEGPRAIDSLLQRGVLGWIFPEVPGPSAHLAPFWPALVAGLTRVTGLHPERAGQLAALTALGLTATLLPVLARRLGFPPRVGWVAGLWLALCPVYTHSDLFEYFTQPPAGLALLVLAAALPWQRSGGGIGWPEVPAWGLALGGAALLEPIVACTAGLALVQIVLRDASSRSLWRLVCLGLIAGLVAQEIDTVSALRTGVFLHGLAGDRAAERTGQHALCASDVLAELPAIMRGWERQHRTA